MKIYIVGLLINILAILGMWMSSTTWDWGWTIWMGFVMIGQLAMFMGIREEARNA